MNNKHLSWNKEINNNFIIASRAYFHHFPPKPYKTKDDEDFERFAETLRPIFLRMRLTDMLKTNPYAKYMKGIITNKRKIPEAEISTMLANYTFKGGIPKKLGDPGVPTIPCSIKGNYVRTALCDLGAGWYVSNVYIIFDGFTLLSCHLWMFYVPFISFLGITY